jgi:hypothetical protein
MQSYNDSYIIKLLHKNILNTYFKIFLYNNYLLDIKKTNKKYLFNDLTKDIIYHLKLFLKLKNNKIINYIYA